MYAPLTSVARAVAGALACGPQTESAGVRTATPVAQRARIVDRRQHSAADRAGSLNVAGGDHYAAPVRRSRIPPRAVRAGPPARQPPGDAGDEAASNLGTESRCPLVTRVRVKGVRGRKRSPARLDAARRRRRSSSTLLKSNSHAMSGSYYDAPTDGSEPFAASR
jgi:hypothetical protein